MNPPVYTYTDRNDVLDLVANDENLVFITYDLQISDYLRQWGDIGRRCHYYRLHIFDDLPPVLPATLVFMPNATEVAEVFARISVERYELVLKMTRASATLPSNCARHFFPEEEKEV